MPTSIKQIRKDNQEIVETTVDVKVYTKIKNDFYIVVDANWACIVGNKPRIT